MYYLFILLLCSLPLNARSTRTLDRTQHTLSALRSTARTLPGVLPEHEDTIATMLTDIQQAIYAIDEALDGELTPRIHILLHKLLSQLTHISSSIDSFDHVDAQKAQEGLEAIAHKIAYSSHRNPSTSLNVHTLHSIDVATRHMKALLTPTLYRRASSWKAITRSNDTLSRRTRNGAAVVALGLTSLAAATAVAKQAAGDDDAQSQGSRSSVTAPLNDDTPTLVIDPNASPISHPGTLTASPHSPPHLTPTHAHPPRHTPLDSPLGLQRVRQFQESPQPPAIFTPPPAVVSAAGELRHFEQMRQWATDETSDFDIADAMGVDETTAYKQLHTYISRMKNRFKKDITQAYHTHHPSCICPGPRPAMVDVYYATINSTILKIKRTYPLWRLTHLATILSNHAHQAFRDQGGKSITRSTTWGTANHAENLLTVINKKRSLALSTLQHQDAHLALANKPGVYADVLRDDVDAYRTLCQQANEALSAPALSAFNFMVIPQLEQRLLCLLELITANEKLFAHVHTKTKIERIDWFNKQALEQALQRPTIEADAIARAINRSGQAPPSPAHAPQPGCAPWRKKNPQPTPSTSLATVENPMLQHAEALRKLEAAGVMGPPPHRAPLPNAEKKYKAKSSKSRSTG